MNSIFKILLAMLLSLPLFAGDFLMPDQAFKPYAKINDKSQIEAGVDIAEDIYLYVDQFSVKLKDSDGISVVDIQKPTSQKHHDDDVYLKSPNYILTLKNDNDLDGVKDIKVEISYQGCSEQGLCYEPSSKEITLKLDTSKLDLNGVKKNQVNELSKTDSIADTIKSGNVLVTLLTFFGFGLLLSLTPCVFPMIPIISGVIISQGKDITTKKAFVLSVVYVLAMAVAYTIAGVLAGLFGSNLQAALQAPWVVYSFAAVFVALAFSMFGFYELKLPDSLVSKVSSNSSRGGFVGVAVMGFLSALIVGPCVAAPLAGALVYIGQTGDALLGGAALFSMSIGMGIPLIVVGVSAGKFMPKPGAWMTMVSAIFGVMMLGVAIWMLEKVVPSSITMLLYALLGIGFALYLGAFEKDTHIFKKTVAVVMFIYSSALFIGFLGGSSSMVQPLGFLKSGVVVQENISKADELDFKVVTSLDELDKLLEKNKGKKILLDFSAQWCTACKEFEEITFADKDVRKKMKEFTLIRADVTKNGADEKALSKKYGVFGPPAIVFFNKDLKDLKSKMIVGYTPPEKFLKHLNSI